MDASTLIYKLQCDKTALNRGLDEVDKDAPQRAARAGKAFGGAFSTELGNTRLSLASPLERAFAEGRGIAQRGAGSISSLINGVFQGIGQGLTSAITGAVSAGIGSIRSLGTEVVRLGSNAEQTAIAFKAIIGDTDKANKLLADLKKFATNTPFTTVETTKATQSLLTTVDPKDMIATLTRLGNVARGTGSDLASLAVVYSQTLSKGKIQGDEMLQLQERGIPINKALAQTLNISEEALSKLISTGTVKSSALVDAFKLLGDEGGKFGGIMATQSQTAAGLFSTLQDGFETAAIAVYDRINPALVAAIKSIGEATEATGGTSEAMDLVGRAAEDVEGLLKKHQPTINATTAALGNMASGALRAVIEGAENSYNWFRQNPEVLAEINKQVSLWGSGIKIILDFGSSLLPIFQGLIPVFVDILKLANQIGEEIQGWASKAIDFGSKVGQNLGLTAPDGAGYANTGIVGIQDPRGNPVHSWADVRGKHHDYQNGHNGQVSDQTLLRRDAHGNITSDNVPVPSPVTGLIESTGWDVKGGNLINLQSKEGQRVTLMHLDKPSPLKRGDSVFEGQSVGIQGHTGDATGNHVHIDADPAIIDHWLRSIDAAKSGVSPAAPAQQSYTGSRIPNAGANLKGYLNVIAEGESDGGRDLSVSSAGARGKYQFIPSTRNYIKQKYGVDAWKPDEWDQAAQALIKDTSPKAYNAVFKGDYTTANSLLNRQWTSLPGGAEQSAKWRNRNPLDYRPGGKYWTGSGNSASGTAPTPTPTGRTDPKYLVAKPSADTTEKTKAPAALPAQLSKKAADAEEAQFRKDNYDIDVTNPLDHDDPQFSTKEYARKLSAYRAEQAEKRAATLKREQDEAARKAKTKADEVARKAEALRAKTPTAFNTPTSDPTELAIRDKYKKTHLHEATADDNYSEFRLGELRKQQEQILKESQLQGDNWRKITAAFAENAKRKQEAEAKLNEAKGISIFRAIAARDAEYSRLDAIGENQAQLQQSDLQLRIAQAAAQRDPEKKRNANIANAKTQQAMELNSGLEQIEKLRRAGVATTEQIAEMKSNLFAVNDLKLKDIDNQFKSLGQTIKENVGQAFGTFLQDVITGSDSVQSAFGKMFSSIASSLAQMGISRLIGGLFGSGISSFAEGSLGGGRRFSNLGDALRYERSASGYKPQLAVINESEFVITKEQMKAFGSIGSFASGNISRLSIPQSNGAVMPEINLGGITVNGASGDVDTDKLGRVLKASIYSTLHTELRSGGLLNRRQ